MEKLSRRYNVDRNQNCITINRMHHPKVVSDFIKCIHHGIRGGYEEFIIIVRGGEKVYPDVCAPIAGLLDYYRIQGLEFDIEYETGSDYVSNANFHDPLAVSDNLVRLRKASLDDIWRFHDFEDVTKLVDAFVNEISQVAVCGTGVLEGITWCLNEVMDNVLQHSGVAYGYAMGQIHVSTQKVAFCIYDYGQGIYGSLKDSRHSPRHPIDAITLAVKEGVTRDKKIGQGNGMWGLHNIVRENHGKLIITSSSASYILQEDEIKTFDRIPYLSRENGATTVDFQIDFSKGISISKALGGHTPLNLRLVTLENDAGNIVYNLASKTSGTGTRQSGQRMRNELINLHRESQSVIEIDFNDISVVSSSFADEVVGKLVTEYGFFGFNQIFRLTHMNELVQSIVNRSVAQRMSQSFVEGN